MGSLGLQRQELQEKFAAARAAYEGYTTQNDPSPAMSTVPVDAANMLLAICQLTKASAVQENIKVTEVSAMCDEVADTASSFFQSLSPDATSSTESGQMEAKLKSLLGDLQVVMGDVSAAAEKKSSVFNQEMDFAQQMVEEASQRMEQMMEQARAEMSETQLSVNSAIMDSSLGLIRLIQLLVKQAGSLQSAIIKAETAGKGHSVAQFYKKNSRWVDGLLSAAKAVGAGATVLVDTADGVLSGTAKFEELMVCGQEIAASTVQLVTASRVKAPSRDALAPLEDTSKKVSNATKMLIEAAREAGAKNNTAKSAQDLLKLSLTQTRRLEMDSQVRVLELENALNQERERLGQLRKMHYHRDDQSAA
jgi:huntingtin interacting protein 1